MLQMIDNNELLKVLCFGVNHLQKYPESVRQFCFALNYHSPSAYRHVRRTFNNNLPHPRTIKTWYANSDAKAEPGIVEENKNRLRKIVEEYRIQYETEMECALIVDEMHLRKQVLCFSLSASL